MKNIQETSGKTEIFSVKKILVTIGIITESKPYTLPALILSVLCIIFFNSNDPKVYLIGIIILGIILLYQTKKYRQKENSLNEIEKTIVLTFMGVLFSVNFAFINYSLLVYAPKNYIILSPDTTVNYMEFKVDSSQLEIDKYAFIKVLQSLKQTELDYIMINSVIQDESHSKYSKYAISIRSEKYKLYSYIGRDNSNSNNMGHLIVYIDSSNYTASGIYRFNPEYIAKSVIEKELLVKLINSSIFEIKKNLDKKNEEFSFIRDSRLKFSNVLYQYIMDLFNRDPKYLKPNSGLAKALDLTYAIVKYFFLTIIIKTLAQRK